MSSFGYAPNKQMAKAIDKMMKENPLSKEKSQTFEQFMKRMIGNNHSSEG